MAYFQDYVSGGRKLGRGNLFIYTLPTSPAAEAAIHFGLAGPLLYVGRSVSAPVDALQDSVGILADRLAGVVLCVLVDELEVACAVVRDVPSTGAERVAIEEAARIISDTGRDTAAGTWFSGANGS